MARKHKPEDIISKLREAEIVLAQGVRWPEDGSGTADDPKGGVANDLEKENARLRRAVSDLTLDKFILQEAARGSTR